MPFIRTGGPLSLAASKRRRSRILQQCRKWCSVPMEPARSECDGGSAPAIGHADVENKIVRPSECPAGVRQKAIFLLTVKSVSITIVRARMHIF
jgi:hypothetical protein